MQRVTPYEAGRWRCEVREYITRWNIFANPRTDSMDFDIEVLNKVRDKLHFTNCHRATVYRCSKSWAPGCVIMR